VAVVFGEGEGFGYFCPAGENVSEKPVAEGAHDGANLAGRDDAAVKLIGVVGDVLVGQLPAHLARLAVAVVHLKAGVDDAAVLGDERADGVEVEIDVDAVGDGALEGVLHDEVLVEEAECLLGGRGREADERGVKVFQYLAPEIVDGAVTFVGDDEIESLDGDGCVVRDWLGWALEHFKRRAGELIELGVELLALEHGVEPLDGGDADLGHRIDAAGLQVLHVVKLGEDAAVVGCAEGLELLESLSPKIAAIDQEEDAAGTGELDEAVEGVACGVSLAGAGGHLDKGAAAAVAQRVFESLDCSDLRGAQAEADERRHGGQAGLGGAAGGGEFAPQPLGERLWPMEAEDIAAGGVGLKEVGEASLNAGGLIKERKWAAWGREGCRDALAVLLGLDLNPDEGGPLLLCLDDADGLAVSEKKIVGLAKPVTEGEFADGNAAAGVDVSVGPVLDEPSSGDKHAVDGLASFLVRRQGCRLALGPQCNPTRSIQRDALKYTPVSLGGIDGPPKPWKPARSGYAQTRAAIIGGRLERPACA